MKTLQLKLGILEGEGASRCLTRVLFYYPLLALSNIAYMSGPGGVAKQLHHLLLPPQLLRDHAHTRGAGGPIFILSLI